MNTGLITKIGMLCDVLVALYVVVSSLIAGTSPKWIFDMGSFILFYIPLAFVLLIKFVFLRFQWFPEAVSGSVIASIALTILYFVFVQTHTVNRIFGRSEDLKAQDVYSQLMPFFYCASFLVVLLAWLGFYGCRHLLQGKTH